jgi:tetratricopeptide (TPR) repeat protein
VAGGGSGLALCSQPIVLGEAGLRRRRRPGSVAERLLGLRDRPRDPQGRGLAASAWALSQLGETSEALERVREGEQLFERQAARGISGRPNRGLAWLGRANLLLGRLDEARRLGDRAVESSRYHQGNAAHGLHLLGDIATHPDQFNAESGEATTDRRWPSPEPRGMRPLAAHCHLGLSKLYRRTGRRDQARERLTTATTMYREMDMRFYLEQAEAAMRGLA